MVTVTKQRLNAKFQMICRVNLSLRIITGVIMEDKGISICILCMLMLIYFH